MDFLHRDGLLCRRRTSTTWWKHLTGHRYQAHRVHCVICYDDDHRSRSGNEEVFLKLFFFFLKGMSMWKVFWWSSVKHDPKKSQVGQHFIVFSFNLFMHAEWCRGHSGLIPPILCSTSFTEIAQKQMSKDLIHGPPPLKITITIIFFCCVSLKECVNPTTRCL